MSGLSEVRKFTRLLEELWNIRMAIGSPGVGMPGSVIENSSWHLHHVPAANTRALATQATAGAGQRNVCTYLFFCLAAGVLPTITNPVIEVVDGVTRIWGMKVGVQAIAGDRLVVATPVLLIGSPDTAMSIGFDAAGGANTFESVSASGFVIG